MMNTYIDGLGVYLSYFLYCANVVTDANVNIGPEKVRALDFVF